MVQVIYHITILLGYIGHKLMDINRIMKVKRFVKFRDEK